MTAQKNKVSILKQMQKKKPKADFIHCLDMQKGKNMFFIMMILY